MSYKLNNVSEWKKGWESKSVQNDNATFGGDFLSSESLVVFSGPPSYDSDFGEMVPIGFVQSVQVSQQKQIQQLFEIGSRKPFFVPGRNVIGGGIGRILFDGPSLMYALYLRTPGTGGLGAGNTGYLNPPPPDKWTTKNALDAPTSPAVSSGDPTLGGANTVSFKGAEGTVPMPNYYFSNLGSSFFNRPTGLGFAMYDGEGQPYGGFYLENCYLQTYSFSVASQQTILMEQVSFRASSIRAINITPSLNP